MSIDDMDRLEQKEMKNNRPIRNTWYDWLINNIPEPIRKFFGGFKEEIVGFLRQKYLSITAKNLWGTERN